MDTTTLMIFIFVVLLILAGTGVGLYFLLRKKKCKKTSDCDIGHNCGSDGYCTSTPPKKPTTPGNDGSNGNNGTNGNNGNGNNGGNNGNKPPPAPQSTQKCCWNREIQGCTKDSDCDSGGSGCIESGTDTKTKFGVVNCNTCASHGGIYDSKNYICKRVLWNKKIENPSTIVTTCCKSTSPATVCEINISKANQPNLYAELVSDITKYAITNVSCSGLIKYKGENYSINGIYKAEEALVGPLPSKGNEPDPKNMIISLTHVVPCTAGDADKHGCQPIIDDGSSPYDTFVLQIFSLFNPLD